MDKANLEIVENAGKVEIKTFGKTGKLATRSVAIPGRWKTDECWFMLTKNAASLKPVGCLRRIS